MTALNPLQKLWLTETVRLREEHAGALEDLEANRLARSAGGDLPTRIQHRALWLAELELGPECYERIKQHSYFFEAAKRRWAVPSCATTANELMNSGIKGPV